MFWILRKASPTTNTLETSFFFLKITKSRTDRPNDRQHLRIKSPRRTLKTVIVFTLNHLFCNYQLHWIILHWCINIYQITLVRERYIIDKEIWISLYQNYAIIQREKCFKFIGACMSFYGQICCGGFVSIKVFQLFKGPRNHDSGNSQHSCCSNEETHTHDFDFHIESF